jgi:uncharacterized protein YerC
MTPLQRTTRTRGARKINRQKVAALAKQGMGVNDIAIHQRVHHSTISRYLDRLSLEGKALKQFNDRRGDALATVHAKALHVQDVLLDHIQEEVMDKGILSTLSAHTKIGYLNTAAVVGGVSYDKFRLEVGKSTANLATLDRVLERAHAHLFQRDATPPVDTEPTDAVEGV